MTKNSAHADMMKLADMLDLESSAKAYRFKSYYLHHIMWSSEDGYHVGLIPRSSLVQVQSPQP